MSGIIVVEQSMMRYWKSSDVDWRDRDLIPERIRADGKSLSRGLRRATKILAISWIPSHQSDQTVAERNLLSVVQSDDLGRRW